MVPGENRRLRSRSSAQGYKENWQKVLKILKIFVNCQTRKCSWFKIFNVNYRHQASKKAISLAIFHPYPLIFPIFCYERDRKGDKSHPFWRPDRHFITSKLFFPFFPGKGREQRSFPLLLPSLLQAWFTTNSEGTAKILEVMGGYGWLSLQHDRKIGRIVCVK